MARIGRYTIVRPLGEGGMGVVYLCSDPQLGREVAVKVIKGASDRDRERFMREARTLAALDHPGIVDVHEVGTHEGSPFMVMEHVVGQDLQARMKGRGPVPSLEAAEIMAQVAGIVAYVHSKGILHRDLKPENVIVTNAGKPMLLDFGLCKAPESYGGLTAPGSGLGSLGFMPPEQLDNALNASQLSDVYGLGATLYALLTGRRPYPGNTTRQIVMDTLAGNAPPPSVLVAGVDPQLDAICAQAMRVDPSQRYPSVQDMKNDLEGFLQGKVVPPAEDLSDEEEATLLLAEDEPIPGAPPKEAAPPGRPEAEGPAAIAQHEKWLKSHPGDTTSRMKLALAYRRAGDTVSAIDQYDIVIAADPNEKRAYVARGVARTDLKDFIGAVADFERALALYPPAHPKAKRIRHALRRASGRLGDTVMRPGRRPG